MYDFMNIEIDLAKIPRAFVKEFTKKDGTKSLCFKAKINKMRQPDQNGNTHTIILLDSKYQQISEGSLKERNMANAYIGKGREMKGGSNGNSQQSSQPVASQQTADDSPF